MPPNTPPPRDSNAFSPLIELLQDELQSVAIEPPDHSHIEGGRDFALWFLEAIQLLERYVASHDDHQPMTRGEVELMCRCALSAQTLGQAFALIDAFTAMLLPRAGRLTVSRRGDSLRLSLDSLRRERSMASSLVDIAGLLAFSQLFFWLSGGRARIQRVGIGEIPRADLMPFLLLFMVPVLAEGKTLYLDYPASTESLEVIASAGDFDEFFQDFPCRLFEQQHSQLEQQVSALISAAVRQALPIPRQAEIAATLTMPLSSFRRRLTAGGQSFRALRDHCLQEHAEQMLRREELTIVDIAQRLGFKDGDTFRNAFRRWTGSPPRQWRQQQLKYNPD